MHNVSENNSSLKIQMIDIDHLVRGRYQPRQTFDAIALQELSASIAHEGILTPLIVRPVSRGGYEIIAGERRWRAAQLVNVDKVPCIVKPCNDEEACRIALMENTARKNLNPIEEAEGIQRLISEFNYTHEKVAESLGKSRTEVTNLLRLLKLDSRVRQLILSGELSESHGKILAGVDFIDQYELVKDCIAKNWSTRELEKASKAMDKSNDLQQQPSTDANIKKLESKLSDHLGASIQIQFEKNKNGYLKINYNTLEEFEGILEKMQFQFEE